MPIDTKYELYEKAFSESTELVRVSSNQLFALVAKGYVYCLYDGHLVRCVGPSAEQSASRARAYDLLSRVLHGGWSLLRRHRPVGTSALDDSD